LELGHHGSDVLPCLGEVWVGSIIFDDPLVHMVGHGACTPTISMALDLFLELRALLL